MNESRNESKQIKEIKDPKVWAAFDSYCVWKSLPKHYSLVSKDELSGKGLPDDIIDLALIKTKKEFAKKFCLSTQMMSGWDSHPDLNKKVKASWKQWCKMYTPNVLAKFYEKLMEEGDAARMKIWMQTIEEEKSEEDGSKNINIGIEAVLRNMKEDGDLNETLKIEVEKPEKVTEILDIKAD
jgi:hypothetical protein